MAQTITMAMALQHAVLNNLLVKYDKSSKITISRDLFQDFRWNMKKHFFLEENVIFSTIDMSDKKESQMVKNLIQDHRDMISIVDNIAEELLDGKKSDLYELRKILSVHESMEVSDFYPKLDKRLPKSLRQEILIKSKEISLK